MASADSVKCFFMDADVPEAGVGLIELPPAARLGVLSGSDAILPTIGFFGVVISLGRAAEPL